MLRNVDESLVVFCSMSFFVVVDIFFKSIRSIFCDILTHITTNK